MRSFFVLIYCFLVSITAQSQADTVSKPASVKTGADRMALYLPLLQGKTIGIFANHTSMVGSTHLVDTLLKRGVQVKKIFAPEHGFRGRADAGEHISNSVDAATGLPIISLYGSHRKPTQKDFEGLDILIFDIQDVGVRFYTFISSLQEFMEAAIQFGKPLMVLDRPNPNGFYVDGPLLEEGFQSFVGMQKIPVVYGMTMAEYAQMILRESWLQSNCAGAKIWVAGKAGSQKPSSDTGFSLTLVPCAPYTHHTYYKLPVKPSPNLPNMQSIWLYPSLCYFEGTEISLGRGTDKPFQLYGHPLFAKNLFSFTPEPTEGAKEPPLKNKKCYGYDLSHLPIDISKPEYQRIQLKWLLNAYQQYPSKDNFFLRPQKNNPKNSDYFFNKLTGNFTLMWQMMNGKTEKEIRQSWEPGIKAFKKIRKKYLLYEE